MSDRIQPISRLQAVHRVMRVERATVEKAKPAGPTFAEVLREAIERTSHTPGSDSEPGSRSPE